MPALLVRGTRDKVCVERESRMGCQQKGQNECDFLKKNRRRVSSGSRRIHFRFLSSVPTSFSSAANRLL